MTIPDLDVSTDEKVPKRVCVVVLGDFGRSPRMKCHCLSLASHGFDVDVLAYGGSKPHTDVLENPKINLSLMKDVPDFAKYMPRLLSYVLKTLWQSTVMLTLLFSMQRPNFVLLQNPPSIPTMPVLWFYCLLRRAKFVIDWHNYGFTILSLSLNETHPLVKLTRWSEGFFGFKADHHLCVTKGMQKDLKSRWNIDAVLLYDRPSEHFRRVSLDEKHSIFVKLKETYPVFAGESEDDTRFTYINTDQSIAEKPNRPVIIISSTSWTEDEDFSILLEALKLYESQAASGGKNYPKIVCIITGKGPLKEHYEIEMQQSTWSYVEFCLPWLEPEDYPQLLASSDLGVCLHTSSSGLDLPMKVVDMFGCCLPVCAIEFECLSELVVDGVNGFVFETDTDLFSVFSKLFVHFPRNAEVLEKFRLNIEEHFANHRWEQSWNETCSGIFNLT